MSRIFISYSRDDSKLVDELITCLEAAGMEVWIDRKSIPGGTEWREKIVKGIRGSDFFIICLSPASVVSQAVLTELNTALELRKTCLPLIIKQVDIPDTMLLQLVGIQWIDYSKDTNEGFEKLLQAVRPEPPIEKKHEDLPDAVANLPSESLPGDPVTGGLIRRQVKIISDDDGNKLRNYIYLTVAILGFIGALIYAIGPYQTKKLEISASQTADNRILAFQETVTNTTPDTSPLPTPTLPTIAVQVPSKAPTQALTPVQFDTPKPECANAYVESMELFLNNGWKKFSFDSGAHIALTQNELSGLTRILGRALFTDPNVLQNCACSWEGGAASPYANLSASSQDCSFSASLTGTVKHLYLILKVDRNQSSFVIDFP